MRKYIIFPLLIFLIMMTSIIKNSTRELETKIFSYEEKIKILTNDKELILLQNNYLSSPHRLFELKEKFFGEELKVLELKKINYLTYEKKLF